MHNPCRAVCRDMLRLLLAMEFKLPGTCKIAPKIWKEQRTFEDKEGKTRRGEFRVWLQHKGVERVEGKAGLSAEELKEQRRQTEELLRAVPTETAGVWKSRDIAGLRKELTDRSALYQVLVGLHLSCDSRHLRRHTGCHSASADFFAVWNARHKC